MQTFDVDSDGCISFDELSNGLRSFKINLTSQEKMGLMKRFDYNRDGEISEEELYKVLSPYDNSKQNHQSNGRSISPGKVSLVQKEKERISVYDIIEKIKKAADKYQSLKHYVSSMMRRYDADGDGFLNFQELSNAFDYDSVRLT